MRSILLRLAAGIIGFVLAGTALLVGGYHLSAFFLPHWPSDYHATVGIALMAISLIVYAGIEASKGSVSAK